MLDYSDGIALDRCGNVRECNVRIRSVFRLMRVQHYIKNLLLFLPLVFSGLFFEKERLLAVVGGFISFCLLSSAVYIMNDIRDMDSDRVHVSKCRRPLAAGDISLRQAVILLVILLVLSFLANIIVFSPLTTALMVLYLLLNLAYSFGLKHVALVDVTIIATGYLLRVVYGALITDIKISNWLYLTVISVSFFFAFGKRRNELIRINSSQIRTGAEPRKVLKFYTVQFLDKNMYMCLAMTNIFYALWSMEFGTLASNDNNYLIFTVPLFLLITMKYSLIIEGESDGDPIEVLLHDKLLLILCLIYILLMFVILYL